MTPRLRPPRPLLLALLALGLCSSAARADERRGVVIVETGSEPACLDVATLARAVSRHALRPAQVLVKQPGASAERTSLAAADAPVSLRVTTSGVRALLELRRGDDRAVESFVIEPCDTLPEQIAAFVAGSLAGTDEPAATEPTPAAAPPSSESPDMSASSDALAAAAAAATEQRARAERAVLLVNAMERFEKPTRVGLPIAAGLLAVGELGFGALVLTAEPNDGTVQGLAIGGAVVGSLGAIGSIALGDSDQAEPMLEASALIGGGLLLMGSSLVTSESHPVHPGTFVFGATYVAAGLGHAVQRVRHPNVASWRVRRRHLARLGTPEARARLTAEELASAEADVKASSNPSNRYLRALPYAIGAAVSVGLIAEYEENDEQLTDLLLVGVAANTILGLLATLPTPYERYQHSLEEAGIQLQVAPTSSGAMLGASGSF
jgi:hypothetical protein